VLVGTLVSIAVTMLGLGAVNVLFVPLLANDLKVPATWFGAVELAQTSSMVLVATMIPAIAMRLRPTSIISVALAATAIDIALLAFVGDVLHVLVLLFIVGFFITPLQAAVSTIVQTHVPDEVMGRVGATLSASIQTASVISMAAAGIFGEVVGIRSAFLLSAAVVAVAAVASIWWFRSVGTVADRGLERAVVARPTR
jgi:MFS family permease